MRQVLAAAAVLVTAGAVSLSVTAAPTVADERAAIRKLWDEAGAALCAGNWRRYEPFWAHRPEIELIHPSQREWLVGWDAIGRKYEELVTPAFRCEFVTRTMRIHVAPAGEMAWGTVDGTFRLPNQPEVTLWETVVFEKRAGRWNLVHGHASAPPAQ